MTDPTKEAIAAVERVRTEDRTPLMVLARRAQDAALASLDERVSRDLHTIDERFDAKVSAASDGEQPPRPRLVTPWPDMLGVFAATASFVAAAGAGRVVANQFFSDMQSVSPTVVVSSGIGIVLLLAGVFFASREKKTLAAEQEESRATIRSVLVITTAVMAAGATVSMLIRFIVEEVLLTGIVAACAAACLLAVSMGVAVRAYRFARSTPSAGKFIYRVRAQPSTAKLNLRLSASESAQDDAHELIEQMGETGVAAFERAYEAAIDAIERRSLLRKADLKSLRATDWAQMRYSLEHDGQPSP